jgi:hypothetical protein
MEGLTELEWERKKEAVAKIIENNNFDELKNVIENQNFPPKVAITSAGFYGRLDMIKYLIEKGADPKANDDEAICWAIANGYMEVVKFLLTQGCDPLGQNGEGIYWMVDREDQEMLQFLIQKEEVYKFLKDMKPGPWLDQQIKSYEGGIKVAVGNLIVGKHDLSTGPVRSNILSFLPPSLQPNERPLLVKIKRKPYSLCLRCGLLPP